MFRLWLRELFPVVSRTTPGTSSRRVRPQVLTLEDRVTPAVVSIADAVLAEGNAGTSVMTFTVSLDVVDAANVTVDYTTADVAANAPTDYAAAAGTVTILAGLLTQTFTVTINGDTTVEADETFTSTLSNVSANATIGVAIGTGTITNDDATALTLSASAVSVTEGGAIVYTVTSSAAVQGGFSVTIGATPNAPTTPGDFTTTGTMLVFAGTAGEKQTFTVTAVDDAIVEPTETYTVALGIVTPVQAIPTTKFTLGAPLAGSILDNDATTLTVSDVTLAENGGSMLFTVTSSAAVQGNFTVDAATAPLTATPGVNYTTTAGTLIFTGTAAGQAQSFSVPILNDGVVSGDKTFQVNLANPVGPVGVPASQFNVTDTAIGTITNVNKTTLTVTGVAQAENAGATKFTVTSSAAVTGGFSVTYSTADGTATVGGSDYTATAGTLIFIGLAGESMSFTASVTPDTIVEADETFTASLTSVTPPAGVLASAFDLTSVGTATIVNDDAATVTINTPAAVTEGTAAVFVLTLSNPVDVAVDVTLTVANLGPTTAADYQPFVSQIVSIPANTLTFNVPVPTFDDAIVEPTEQFTLTISAVGPPTRAVSIGIAKTGTATILDNDTTTLTVSNVTQFENTGPMLFTVTSSNAVQDGFAVNFATADGTAKAGVPDLDYTTKAGTLNFVGTAGESKTFSVPITADNIVELDETFTASLNAVAPTDVTIPTTKFVVASVGTGTIVNDEVAVISVSSPTATEGGDLVFVFTLSNPVDVPVTFQIEGTDITTTAGADYAAIVGQVIVIPAGKTSVPVNVTTVDDRRVEGTETFTVALSKLTGQGTRPVTLDPTTRTATISDNDTAIISFSKAADAFPEDNRATTFDAVFTITATGSGTIGLDRNVTVSFTSGGTAVLGPPATGVGVGQYTASFPGSPTFSVADGTVFTRPVTLTVFENLTNEGDKTATVTVALPADPTGGQVTVDPAQNLFTLTIQNDDAVVRTYDATVPGAYRLVRNDLNVELYSGATLVAVETFGTAPILLNGTSGDDSLQIDYSGGNPVPLGGVTFDGKGGNDRLTVTGGSFVKIASTLTDANSGAIAFTDPLLNGSVSYRNLELETLLDPTAVGEMNFVLPAAASTARLQEDAGVAGNGKAEFVSVNTTFLATRFVVPSALFSADRGTPADTFELTSAGPIASDVVSSVRVGTPATPFADVTVSGTLASNNAVELNGKTIAVNAPLSAVNSVRLVAETAATQSAAIATNTLQLGVGGPGNYTLTAANKAVNLGANTKGNVAYTDADAINLVSVGIGGSFDLTTGGAITQSAPATVAGPTTLTAGPNPIALADPANDFSSVRVVSGSNVALADANALVLAGVAVTGNFTVTTTNGAVTQTASVLVTAGATRLSTGTGNVTLTDPANDFTTLTVVSGGTDTVRDANALTLLGATLGALDVQAVTDLLVAGNATATASGVGLRAGNLVRVNSGVVIRAATTVVIAVTAAAGGTVDLRGADLVATASTIDGGTGADTFLITGTTTPVAINGRAPTGTPTGDELDFFAQGKDVFATPNSFNTAGAPVSYLDIETVRLLNPAAVALDGSNGDDVLTISRTPTGPLSYRLNGDVPVEAVGTTRFRFNGLNGADTLIADFAGGSPVPAGGVLFDGGVGNDIGLFVLGAKNTANFTTTAAGPGLSGRVSVDASNIDFIDFETTSQVDITNMAKVTVAFATADDTLTVSNGFDATAGKVNPALIVSGPATPRVGLWNNADATLDTTTNDGNDTITVASADNAHGNTNLTILTGSGNDTVAVTGGIAVDGNLRVQTQAASVTGATVLARTGFVRVENAKTLTLSAATITAGTSFTQASGGPVALVGQSTATAKDGDIEFTGTIDGPGGLAVNTARATLFDQALGATTALGSLTTDAPGTTEVRGKLVRTSGVQSYGDPVTFTQSGTQFLGTSGSITFGGTLDSAAAGFDLTVGGPGVNVTFANAVGSKATVGTLLVPDANDVTLNGPVTATTFVQTQGTGTTTVNGPLTATGTTPVTGYTSGGAINIGTKSVVFAGAISAPNAPIVLRLGDGATQPGGQLTTTKLYLNGAGNFTLNQPGNALTNGTAELFAALTSGSISVRDSSDLAIRFEDPSKAAIAITGGGNVTLITRGNFAAEDPRASATARENGVAVPPGSLVALFNVGGGTVQVFFSVGRANTESATVVFVAEAKAGQVILGQAGTGVSPNGFDNVTKDNFIVRPALGTKVIVNGNFPVSTSGKAFSPFDSLAPQFVGVGGANLSTQGAADGTFSFPGSGFQPLVYTSIESFEGRSAETFSVQTAPRLGSTASTSYAVRVRQTQNVAGQSVPINSELGGSGIIPNPFVVSPSLLSPLVAYSAPRVTLADVNADGTPDLIIANGAGDAPAITIIDGTALNKFDANDLPIPLDLANLDPAVILAQFFPFAETFRGGLSVATGDFDGDGKLEIVVGAGIGGGPRVQVFKIDSRPTVVGVQVQLAVNGDGKLVPIAFQNVLPYLPEKFNFFAFESSQRGGVNVTVGDFNNDNVPDIVVGAGPGGAPRVRIIDGKTGIAGPSINDFFAYDSGFRGGVFVDAGRYDTGSTADLVTAPGAGGGPHVKVFLGSGTAGGLSASEIVGFMAYDFPTGLVGGANAASAFFTGVGGVAFGAAQDVTGSRRAILVTAPRGSEFTVTRFDSTDDIRAVPTKTVNYQHALGSPTPTTSINLGTSAAPDFVEYSVLRDGGSASGFAVSSKAS
jgi:hypothetical protein